MKLGLAESIAALRGELTEAVAAADDAGIRFEVGEIELEFHVGVTRQSGGRAGVRFWVVEMGGEGSYAKEQIQRITLTLLPPRDGHGDTVKVGEESARKP
ncbi:trypco2 family protein [Streptomyces sp. NPDC051018]|uniref:trypco2 family protein n=1 Tax=Streptomyces sp. NPDC051018 TaxID=3365639 RepID=UPI0037BA223A